MSRTTAELLPSQASFNTCGRRVSPRSPERKTNLEGLVDPLHSCICQHAVDPSQSRFVDSLDLVARDYAVFHQAPFSLANKNVDGITFACVLGARDDRHYCYGRPGVPDIVLDYHAGAGLASLMTHDRIQVDLKNGSPDALARQDRKSTRL